MPGLFSSQRMPPMSPPPDQPSREEVMAKYTPLPSPKIIEVPYTPPESFKQSAAELEKSKKLLRQKRKGRKSTILTGPQGVLESADVKKPQLLGGY